ncbi:tetratricopeptide repeat protein [Nocardioides sp. TRM66260-LWL]|uniref:co-chaperone YbbN n=1 Tax=Nocardioides sp. TRM66260-LWL TaxID=2874478 RepID=UPI001CC5E38F|nr:tetratricopeptide repeat protein [Nocardioides sp. TRM66260-LWL]MBZ5734225.1 tetratricopeptide repeat protein [Nocardioides sp. TRM66260-LWL]
MTQVPFSRPGAIDLSALKRPAPAAPSAPAAGAGGGGVGGPAAAGGAASAYAVDITEAAFQAVVEASMTAPVLLVFYSPSRMPESAQLADDVATLSAEFEGRFLAGLVDIDAEPGIAQAMQIPSIPLVVAIIDGRPAPLLQDVLPIAELRTALTQVMQQLTVQGITGRHQPRHAEAADEEGEAVDPRYAAADAALAEGDVETAIAEYQRLVDANPADHEAAAGLAMARVLLRTRDADPAAARAAADAAPDDVDAQILAADLDLLDGRVDEAFGRLVELVRRTADADRTRAREHLVSLFAAVGNDDPRVLRGRQSLASALF